MKKTQQRVCKGFTLIELLVVVLIIGILSAVALPQYEKAVVKARLSEMDVILNTYQKALSLYLLSNGGLPSEVTNFTGSNATGELDVEIPALNQNTLYDCNEKLGWRVACRQAQTDSCTITISTSSTAGTGTTCASKSADHWGGVESSTEDLGKTWRLYVSFVEGRGQSVPEWKKKVICQWARTLDENPSGC